MKQILSSIFILFLVSLINVSAEDKKSKLSQDQVQGIKAAEEKYKDNPYALGVIKQLKKNNDITDEEQQASTPDEPAIHTGQPQIIQGSRSTADKAYAKGDYETALEHYQALAEKGDPDASLILGTMYEQGQGADVDKAAAHSWYKKSAEGGDERGEELMMLIEDTSMSSEDMAEADKRYEEISGQEEKSRTGEIFQHTGVPGQIKAAGSYVQSSNRQRDTAIRDKIQGEEKSQVRWTPFVPVKTTDPEYIKPVTVSSAFQPDRFYRN